MIELRESQAVRREFVDIRSIDFAAVAADVRLAHVIRHDHHEIGATVGVSKCCQQHGSATCIRSSNRRLPIEVVLIRDRSQAFGGLFGGEITLRLA